MDHFNAHKGEYQLKQLWSPWRLDYILREKPDSCAFCLPQGTEEDDKRMVLYRGRLGFVIMNKFPYANGHLLVVPNRHVKDLTDLTDEEGTELFRLLQISSKALEHVCSPEGMNIGLNIGEAAGAGIRGHLHFHIVPRWNGDSSFMAVLDEVRVIPEHIRNTYNALKPIIGALANGESDIHGGNKCGL